MVGARPRRGVGRRLRRLRRPRRTRGGGARVSGTAAGGVAGGIGRLGAVGGTGCARRGVSGRERRTDGARSWDWSWRRGRGRSGGDRRHHRAAVRSGWGDRDRGARRGAASGRGRVQSRRDSCGARCRGRRAGVGGTESDRHGGLRGASRSADRSGASGGGARIGRGRRRGRRGPAHGGGLPGRDRGRVGRVLPVSCRRPDSAGGAGHLIVACARVLAPGDDRRPHRPQPRRAAGCALEPRRGTAPRSGAAAGSLGDLGTVAVSPPAPGRGARPSRGAAAAPGRIARGAGRHRALAAACDSGPGARTLARRRPGGAGRRSRSRGR